MRWIPLQSMESKKWMLCVLFDDCMTYDVTSVESDHVTEILHYAAYMNGTADDSMGAEMLEKLDVLKREYESN